MIPIVEDYLSELIQGKLKYIKSNPSQIDKLFGASNSRISRFKSFLQNEDIKVVRGYPRTSASVPCYCLLLSSEEESQESLGDYVEDDNTSIDQFTEEVIVKYNEKGALSFRTTHKPLRSLNNIVHNELGAELSISSFEIVDPYKGDVLVYDGTVEHGDSLTIGYSYDRLSIESNSTMFECNYRIEVWAGNADLVVEMYHLCKWMLLSARDFLGDDKELYRQRLSGADFEPAPNFFPDFVYRRALMFWCQLGISAPDGDSYYISDVEVDGHIEGSEE